MDMLSVIWFAAATGGAVIGLAGLILHGWRQQLFLSSAACFVVCGILGILSIGLLFLALAALLIVVLGRGVVTVVPVTSNVRRAYPFQVLLTTDATGLACDSKAQAEQVRSVAVERIGERIGALAGADLAVLDEALRLHLAL